MIRSPLTRRSALWLLAGVASAPLATRAAGRPAMLVHKDPNCGCCAGWVAHVEKSGFPVTVNDTARLNAVKARLGIPAELAACHTAEIDGYVIEGHVPAAAIERLLAQRPSARGLAVPGMPVGSPGMEGGEPETYEVVLFGPQGTGIYARFRGDREAP
jgi:hypothetical protein